MKDCDCKHAWYDSIDDYHNYGCKKCMEKKNLTQQKEYDNFIRKKVRIYIELQDGWNVDEINYIMSHFEADSKNSFFLKLGDVFVLSITKKLEDLS